MFKSRLEIRAMLHCLRLTSRVNACLIQFNFWWFLIKFKNMTGKYAITCYSPMAEFLASQVYHTEMFLLLLITEPPLWLEIYWIQSSIWRSVWHSVVLQKTLKQTWRGHAKKYTLTRLTNRQELLACKWAPPKQAWFVYASLHCAT